MGALQGARGGPVVSSPNQDYCYVPSYSYNEDFLPPLKEFAMHLPKGRDHSRTVMKTYGWPIKFAKSLLELVGAMLDALIGEFTVLPPLCSGSIMLVGHEFAYSRGVLHRDISAGNIIITGKLARGRRGVLIDFDNAIFWRLNEHFLDNELSVSVGCYSFGCNLTLIQGTRPFMATEILLREKWILLMMRWTMKMSSSKGNA